jgi:hypothetical protein
VDDKKIKYIFRGDLKMKRALRSISIVMVAMLLLGFQSFAMVALPTIPAGTLYVSSALAGTVAKAVVTVDGQQGTFGTNVFATIATANTAAVAGNTIKIFGGTYGASTINKQVNVQILADTALTLTLTIANQVVLEGIANASGVYPTINLGGFTTATWGITVQYSDVTIKNLNVINSKHYSIKPQLKNDKSSIQNFKIENVTIDNSTKTGLDFNGVNNITIKDVTVKNTKAGTGVSFTDCNNVSMDNVKTISNAWGGIALYTGTTALAPGVKDISFTNMTPASQTDIYPLYSQAVAPYTVTNVNATEIYPYTVLVKGTNIATSKNEIYTFYFPTRLAAKTFSDAYVNPTYSGMTKEILQVKAPVTATVSYSTTDTTSENVVATLVPSEDVTVTNNEGLLTYTFAKNGSFTFEFKDSEGTVATAIATVANIKRSNTTAPAVPVKDRVVLDFSYAYLYGYEYGAVGATDTVKREEAAALIYRLLKQNEKLGGYTKPAQATFADVETNRWSFGAIEYMASIDVFDVKNARVKPGTEITRGEASKIIAYSMGLQPNDGKDISFTDLPQDNTYYNCIKALVDAGILIGYEGNLIKPEGVLTRAEYVTMINRLIGRDNSYDIEGVAALYPDIEASNWAYNDIMRASLGFSDDGTGKFVVDPAKKLKRSQIDYN